MNKYEEAFEYFTEHHLDCKDCYGCVCKNCELPKNKYKLDEACKKAEAFEIIIGRELNIQLFRKHNYKDYKEYLDYTSINENSTLLTEEEFELLKEVLSNE